MYMPKLEKNEARNKELLLTEIFDVLRDPIRREVIRRLSQSEQMCLSFADLGSPSGMSYHFARLRTAGLTATRKAGTCRMLSLRVKAVETAFPGLLPGLLRAITKESVGQNPAALETPADDYLRRG